MIELSFHRPLTQSRRSDGRASGIWDGPQPPGKPCWKKPSASPKTADAAGGALRVSSEELEQQAASCKSRKPRWSAADRAGADNAHTGPDAAAEYQRESSCCAPKAP